MAVQKTKAIVLGYYSLGEADRIIVFYTRDYGKVRAVARGARKIKSALCGRLEILTFGDLVFFQRADRDLHIINSFDIVDPFQVLREDILKMAYCSYFAELLQQVESEDEANADTFDLMLNVMSMMKSTDDPEMLARTFEIRLLTGAGFSPQLDSCVSCSKSIDQSGHFWKNGFSVSSGGVLCGECSRLDPNAVFISRGTVEVMKRIQRAPLELIPRLRMSEVNRQELKGVFSKFISFHVGNKRLNSLDFLASIESESSFSRAC